MTHYSSQADARQRMSWIFESSLLNIREKTQFHTQILITKTCTKLYIKEINSSSEYFHKNKHINFVPS